MSMLSKAAKRFDEVFAAQPPETTRAVALAIYRAFPAIQQYQRDLLPLTEDERVVDAIWDLALACAFQLVKRGKDAFGEKFADELRANAPRTAEFLLTVGQMIEGMIPGAASALPVSPPRALLEPIAPEPEADK